LMTWQAAWTRKASLWADGEKQGQGGQAGGDGVVWEGS
jgi:hypothetical protein